LLWSLLREQLTLTNGGEVPEIERTDELRGTLRAIGYLQ
jgi:hypothetical protein